MKAAMKTERGLERGQPCPRLESKSAIRADKAVRAPDDSDGFVDTQIGRLPATWQVKPIRDAYSFTKKPRGLSIDNDAVVPFLPMEAIPLGRLRVSEFEERRGSALTSGTYIENGDLLVAKITPSFENGKQAIVDWKNPFGFATTEVIPNYNRNEISVLKIPLPGHEEQREIADAIGAVDAKIDLHRRRCR